ncbi:hypothetical protein QC763_101565 [Podospora pseudopauciseta]|uniref:J domain-containing protein n=1 Tax=Podospora pseudopauciseta TaxID=2093780 RepID=A0ABR0HWI2_9PEZI|nr:hypothetical protein QC763_101565 [Podospora pseudopauciseta]
MDPIYPTNVEPAKPDYYFDLGFPTFDDEHTYIERRDIKAAWLKLIKQHHPDKRGPGNDGDTAEFRRVQEAYDYLRDEDKRTRYDEEYPRIRVEWFRYRKLASEEEDAARREIEASEREITTRGKARREAERPEKIRNEWNRFEAKRQREFVAEWIRLQAERQAEDASRRAKDQEEPEAKDKLRGQKQGRREMEWEERRLRAVRHIEELEAVLQAERAERYERTRREGNRQREEWERRRWQRWVEESERMVHQHQESFRGAEDDLWTEAFPTQEPVQSAQNSESESTQTYSESEVQSVATEEAPFYCRHALTGWAVRFGRAECFLCGRVKKGWMSCTRQCPACKGRACRKCKKHYVESILRRRHRRYQRERSY